jgi:hypothetical protein
MLVRTTEFRMFAGQQLFGSFSLLREDVETEVT